MKAIIFDLDGVLCHTDEYHYMAWKNLVYDKHYVSHPIFIIGDTPKSCKAAGDFRRHIVIAPAVW